MLHGEDDSPPLSLPTSFTTERKYHGKHGKNSPSGEIFRSGNLDGSNRVLRRPRRSTDPRKPFPLKTERHGKPKQPKGNCNDTQRHKTNDSSPD